MVKFNIPYLTGNEGKYIDEVLKSRHLSGDGTFTRQCNSFFENRWKFKKCLLTTSCTDALEMIALLLAIKPGDEVIMPSYTFVSTANAFALRGARIIFTDSNEKNPNLDVALIENLITTNTKAIVAVHYAGIACDMDVIMEIANKHKLFVVEDAANAIDGYYKGKPLGSIGNLAAFSFHETKNIQCGEGGMLVVNDALFAKRAEIIREKGTNRSAFFRGEVDKYGWVDLGSSFLPSEMSAAFLYAQLEKIDYIQAERKKIWEAYYNSLKKLEEKSFLRLPFIPDYATNNGHMFYLICNSAKDREGLISHLKSKEIQAVFHYLSLHKSVYYTDKHDGRELIYSDLYSDRLVRLPLWVGVSMDEVKYIVLQIENYYKV